MSRSNSKIEIVRSFSRLKAAFFMDAQVAVEKIGDIVSRRLPDPNPLSPRVAALAEWVNIKSSLALREAGPPRGVGASPFLEFPEVKGRGFVANAAKAFQIQAKISDPITDEEDPVVYFGGSSILWDEDDRVDMGGF